jgi:hypothetical protein
MSGEAGLSSLLSGFSAVSVAQLEAARDSRVLEAAYRTLGITSRDELMRTMEAARQAYADMDAAGWQSADQQVAARAKVLEAERAAGIETRSIWEQWSITATSITSMVTGLFTNTSATMWDMGRQFVTSFTNMMIPGLGQVINIAWPMIQAGLKKMWDAFSSFFGSVWDGIKSIGSALGGLFGKIGGLFKGEGAKTNDTRDEWMASLGGLEGAHGIIGSFSNECVRACVLRGQPRPVRGWHDRLSEPAQ